ncbi:MAG: DUF885 domain-containing protein [Bryobacterales bacterium]|nr:DUF885 domain-containing protein [Bryobacterales bacterium]
MPRRPILLACTCLLASCGGSAPEQPFPALVQEFVTTTLSLSPVAATGAGYHAHNGIPLDDQLDSFSTEAVKQRVSYYKSFQTRLEAKASAGGLSAQDLADYELMRDMCRLALFELEVQQRYRHDPALYVELVGNALFTPLVLEYAPLETRYQHISMRLRQVARLLGEARHNLADSPELTLRVALQENDGNRDLIVNRLRQSAPPSERAPFERAASEALSAIDSFNAFLTGELSQRKSGWRLGTANYALKFSATMGIDLSPGQVLAEAETELERTRARMHELARGMYAKLAPGRTPPSDADALTREVLDRIASKHASRETYFDEARKGLVEVRGFVGQRGFVPMPPNDNLSIVPTPEFMRGNYSVGGFNGAPALEPKLGAFYWLTPIPETWDSARVESKLREYNEQGLRILTIHEAIPGHYLQFEFANQVEPRWRRALRAVYANGPYVEGWAVYATQLMLDEGYQSHDPEFALTFYKQMLRVISNAILDIRFHTAGLTDEQAMELMTGKTFQEREEADGKLQRAKLSSAQLPTYFVGWRQWLRTREAERQRQGQTFQLLDFHRRGLLTGAVTMPSLRKLLAAGQAGTK